MPLAGRGKGPALRRLAGINHLSEQHRADQNTAQGNIHSAAKSLLFMALMLISKIAFNCRAHLEPGSSPSSELRLDGPGQNGMRSHQGRNNATTTSFPLVRNRH